jgi:hypothetical protein
VHEKGTEISSALGETFAHRVQYRLLLSKIPNSSNGYTALLKKSVEHSRSAAQFAVSILYYTAMINIFIHAAFNVHNLLLPINLNNKFGRQHIVAHS